MVPVRVFQWATCAILMVGCSATLCADERPRLAVLTDIGGDPDDTQSLVRLLVYANEFEIEALIASALGTPGELKESTPNNPLTAIELNRTLSDVLLAKGHEVAFTDEPAL